MTHLGGTSGPMAQVHNAESQPLTDQPEHGRGLAPYQRRSTLSAAEEWVQPQSGVWSFAAYQASRRSAKRSVPHWTGSSPKWSPISCHRYSLRLARESRWASLLRIGPMRQSYSSGGKSRSTSTNLRCHPLRESIWIQSGSRWTALYGHEVGGRNGDCCWL